MIDSNVVIALIVTFPPTILAFLALKKSRSNGEAINNVHLSINSRFDEFLRLATAKGFLDGQNQEREDAKKRLP